MQARNPKKRFNETKWLRQEGIAPLAQNIKRINSRAEAVNAINKMFGLEEDPAERLKHIRNYIVSCNDEEAKKYLEAEKKLVVTELRRIELLKSKKLPVSEKPITSLPQAMGAFYSMASLVKNPEEQLKFLNIYLNSCKDQGAFKFLSNKRHDLLEEKLGLREAELGVALHELHAPLERLKEVESGYNRPLLVYSPEELNGLAREYKLMLLKLEHSRVRGMLPAEFERKLAFIDITISLQNALGGVAEVEKTKLKEILKENKLRKRYKQLLAGIKNSLSELVKFEAGKKEAVKRYSSYLESVDLKLKRISEFEEREARRTAGMKKKDWKGRY